MTIETFAALDAMRRIERQAVRALCYAPFVNLYFDGRGDVRVCCWNKRVPVGNILVQTMDEIWHGPVITRLRQTMTSYDFAEGCDFCRFQTAEGVFVGLRMTKFDRFAVTATEPKWPREMEFSISNACNLECVMCTGEPSSAIRAHRERCPPKPRLYSNAVLEQLRPYLAHLDQAKFLGGELEHFRLWDMMIEDKVKARCHVTTNGTQYDERIAGYLARLDFGFCLSLDAVTRETYERIRVNASHEAVMANAQRFREYSRARHTSFSFGFCLMRQNWHEFGDFCLMADSWDASVALNTVRQPTDMAIYTLAPAELRQILEGLERQAPLLERLLARNRSVWFDELERIRAKVHSAERRGRISCGPCDKVVASSD